MSEAFKGIVLRKPTKAQSNSPFSGEADTLVKVSDRSVYDNAFLENPEASEIEYLVVPNKTSSLVVPSGVQTEQAKVVDASHGLYQFNEKGLAVKNVSVSPVPDFIDEDVCVIQYNTPIFSTPNVQYEYEPLSLFYTKNDHITRFGYDSFFRKWLPLKGSSPDRLGFVDEDTILRLVEVTPDLGLRLTLGSPSGFVPNIEWIWSDTNWPPTNLPANTIGVLVDTGELYYSQDILDLYQGQEVFQFRNHFPSDSNGLVGRSGDSLFLSPIPSEDDKALIRLKYDNHLKASPTTQPHNNDDVRWDPSTGELFFMNPVEDGLDVYFDGVFSHQQPIFSQESQDLGTISTTFIETTGLSPIDLNTFDKDSLFLYVKETGIAIREIEWLYEPEGISDLKRSFELPEGKVQILVNTTGDEASVQISSSFSFKNSGYTLAVGSGDFYLEKGITFRMDKSAVDPTKEKGVPDAQALLRVENQTVVPSIRQGFQCPINQIPVQNVAGYGNNIFFLRQEGMRRRLLIPEEDVVYDFDNNRLLWTERVLNDVLSIPRKQAHVKLNHEALYNSNYRFELDTGSGFRLLPENEYEVDTDAGEISFIHEVGSVLSEGLCSVDGNSVTTLDILFNFSFEKDLVLVLPTLSLAFDIEDVVSQTELKIAHESSPFYDIPFYVLKGPEKVFSNVFHNVDLGKKWVVLQVLHLLDVSVPNYAPSLEGLEFLVNENPYPYTVLTPENLGKMVDLDKNPVQIFLPSQYRHSYSNFQIWRGTTLLSPTTSTSPEPDTYRVDTTTWEILFGNQDILTYPELDIILNPKLSLNKPSGDIEVLEHTLEVSLPDSISSESVEMVTTLKDTDFSVQEQSGLVFLGVGLPKGVRMKATYHVDSDTVIEEDIGFLTKETLNIFAKSVTVYGDGEEILGDRPKALYINGVKKDVQVPNKHIGTSLLDPNQNNVIHYYVRRSKGGENLITLNQKPFKPKSYVAKGSSQEFWGDHTTTLLVNSLLKIDDALHTITSSSYDVVTDKTKVTLNPPVLDEEYNVEFSVTHSPVTEKIALQGTLDRHGVGDTTLQIFGTFPDILESQVLFLDNAPHLITSVSPAENLVEIKIANPLLKEFDSPNIQISEHPVFSETPNILQTRHEAFDTFPVLMKMENGKGEVLEQNTHYQFLSDGSLVIDPVVSKPPKGGEVWKLQYKAKSYVSPYYNLGRLIIPRLRSSYSRYINATQENGIAGSRLLATYSFWGRDSYYFRILPLEDFAGEVAESLGSGGDTSGALVGFAPPRRNEDHGVKTLIWEEGDIKDRDRIGRRFLSYFSEVAYQLELYLQALDGRVVGDRSGKFSFRLSNDGQAGGDNPYTGEIIPYYAMKNGGDQKPTSFQILTTDIQAQEGYIRNSIDDYVLTSRKPFRFTFAEGFRFLGTFKQAWEPHQFSRFYPQKAEVALITPPSRSEDPNNLPTSSSEASSYTFFQDFLRFLGDLKHEDILSIQSLATRPARAWVADEPPKRVGSGVRIKAGVLFPHGSPEPFNEPDTGSAKNPNLINGNRAVFVPGFKVGDLVSLGRVVYTKNPDGGVDRDVFVYAQNMKISSVSGDYITLDKLDIFDPFPDLNPDLFEDPNNPNSPMIEQATDPLTLLGDSADTHYSEAESELTPYDTIFAKPEDYFRQSFDYGVDSSEGELVNHRLPNFLGRLFNQNAPPPLTYLDATISFKNKRTEPFRFPALDGEPFDDYGLNGIPYGHPVLDSEVVSFGQEERSFTNLSQNTVEGLVETVQVDKNALVFPYNLEDLVIPPAQYDAVFLENQSSNPQDWSGHFTPFFVAHVEQDKLFLAAFKVEESTVPFTIHNAHVGSGTRPSLSRWEIIGEDFTGLNGLSGTLTIEGTPYTVSGFGDGYIDVTGIITVSSGQYSLEVSGTGEIEQLHFLSSSQDFSSVQDTATVSLNSTYHTDTYNVAEGLLGELHVYPLDWQGMPSPTLCAVSTGAKALEGEGQEIGLNEWVDLSQDFTEWADIKNPYLNIFIKDLDGTFIGVEKHPVLEFHPDKLVVDGDITATGLQTYVLSSTSKFGKGHGAVKALSEKKIFVKNSDLLEDIEKGHVLVIPSDTGNGGYYRVSNINTSDSPYPSITLDRSLRTTVGEIEDPDDTLHEFPLKWETYNPRRFSKENEVSLDSLLQRRVIYQDKEDAPADIKDLLEQKNYESRNPVTPSLDILENLVQTTFGTALFEDVCDVIEDIPNSRFLLHCSSADFTTLANALHLHYLTIKEGLNKGFYRISEVVDAHTIALEGGNFFAPDMANFLVEDTDAPFSVYKGEIFSERTYEFIFFEYYNIVILLDMIDEGIRGFLESNGDLLSQEGRRLGDPSDSEILNYLTGSFKNLPVGIQSRMEWLTVSPSVINEVFGILKGSENLYDMRYAWIDYRINLEYGTLVQKRKFRRQKEKKQRENLRTLLRALSLQR
jgi:hypothetical protein